MSRRGLGYICIVCAAVLWASSGTMGKFLFDGGMEPSELVQIRVTLAALLLGVIFGVVRPSLLRIRLRDIGLFVVAGGAFMALVQFTYFKAISIMPVAAAILIQYTAPVFVAAYSIAFWRERFTPLKACALAFSLAGSYLVVGAYDLELFRLNRLGLLIALASALTFAGYILIAEKLMHRYSPWTVTLYALGLAALVWNVVRPPFELAYAGLTLDQWGRAIYISVAGTLLAFGLFAVGVSHVRSTRATITSTLEPISAGVLSYIFLGEILEVPQILGGALVVGAVTLLQLQQEHDEMAPDLIRNKPEIEVPHGGGPTAI